MEEDKFLVVYTDGGCHGNPGPGGWGAVIIDGNDVRELSGGEAATTNNRMELTAAIRVLEAVSAEAEWAGKTVRVFIDSQYVKNGITGWIANWKRNGWRTAAKKPVLNRDLWERLDALASSLSVQWVWVKGHAGVKYNEICDRLCQKEIAQFE
ncbi:MAG: ribonuclease HI [Treponema sp.]|nr:ribonuclease HI [Treponema sp.]